MIQVIASLCIAFISNFSECLTISTDAGAMDPASILEQIELQIAKVKEEAFSRKEILEKIEKWLAACEEECWLEEYNRVGCYTISLCFILLYLNCLA